MLQLDEPDHRSIIRALLPDSSGPSSLCLPLHSVHSTVKFEGFILRYRKMSFHEFFNLTLRDAKVQLHSLRQNNPSNPPRIVDFQYLFETNRILGFYFVEHHSHACKAFTVQLRSLYNNLKTPSPSAEKQKRPFGSPAKIRRFFNGNSKLKQSQSKLLSSTNSIKESIEIVSVSMDQDEDSYQRTIFETEGWWSLPFGYSILKVSPLIIRLKLIFPINLNCSLWREI